MSNVTQFPGEVSRVCGLESGIGKTLSCAVCGREVLKHVEAFSEVRSNGCFNDFATWLGHEATHSGELLHLALVTSCTRVHEQVDRV